VVQNDGVTNMNNILKSSDFIVYLWILQKLPAPFRMIKFQINELTTAGASLKKEN
jgi:hypothetical protein